MSLLSLMPRTLNFGVERASQRAQVSTLGMEATGSSGSAAQSIAAGPAAGAAQATLGAEGVQPPTPPQPLKIILGSTVRGAIQGASTVFGLNWMAGKFPPVAGFLGKILSFIPFIPKVSFPVGTLVALGAGAAVGAVFGLISGIRKSRSEAAKFAAVQAAEQQQQVAAPVGDPLIVGPDGKPVAIDPATNMPVGAAPGTSAGQPSPADAAAARIRARTRRRAKKNPVMSEAFRSGKVTVTKSGAASNAGHGSGTRHHIVRGDTLWALSRRYGVSIGAIVKANADKIKDPDLIYAGDTIVIPT